MKMILGQFFCAKESKTKRNNTGTCRILPCFQPDVEVFLSSAKAQSSVDYFCMIISIPGTS